MMRMTSVLAVTFSCCCALIVPADADAPRPGAIRLSVDVAKATYLIGEPIDVVLTYTNVSPTPVEFRPRVGLNWADWDFVSCQITRPDGTRMEFRPASSGRPNPNALIEGISLAPGESCVDRANFTAGLVDVPWLNSIRSEIDILFDEPGDYALQVKYHQCVEFLNAPIWRGGAVSEPVTVCIVSPPAAEAAASESWSARTVTVGLAYFGTGWGPEPMAFFQQFLRDHPTSVYADYARYYLAECYARINPHQPENALPVFREVIALGRPHVYLREARLGVAECCLQLDDLAGARVACEEIINGTGTGAHSLALQRAQHILRDIDGAAAG